MGALNPSATQGSGAKINWGLKLSWKSKVDGGGYWHAYDPETKNKTKLISFVGVIIDPLLFHITGSMGQNFYSNIAKRGVNEKLVVRKDRYVVAEGLWKDIKNNCYGAKFTRLIAIWIQQAVTPDGAIMINKLCQVNMTGYTPGEMWDKQIQDLGFDSRDVDAFKIKFTSERFTFSVPNWGAFIASKLQLKPCTDTAEIEAATKYYKLIQDYLKAGGVVDGYEDNGEDDAAEAPLETKPETVPDDDLPF